MPICLDKKLDLDQMDACFICRANLTKSNLMIVYLVNRLL